MTGGKMRSWMLALAFVFGLTGAAPVATAQGQPQAQGPLGAFQGVWKLNAARSRFGREGPNGTPTPRSATFTWVYKSNPTGLNWTIYNTYPQAAPDKVMTATPDGVYRPCEMKETCLSRPGDPKDQSYAFWRMSPVVFMRVFRIRGAPDEYNLYTLSPDHKTFVTTVWSPGTPEYQTMMVFEKQADAP